MPDAASAQLQTLGGNSLWAAVPITGYGPLK